MVAIFFKVAPRNKNETGQKKEEEKGTRESLGRWVGGWDVGRSWKRG
jgi:hypothetical protein